MAKKVIELNILKHPEQKNLLPLLPKGTRDAYWKMVDRYSLDNACLRVEIDEALLKTSDLPIVSPSSIAPPAIPPKGPLTSSPFERAARELMRNFYWECYGMEINPWEPIPGNPGGFDMALYMPQGGPNMIEDIYNQRRRYKVWIFSDDLEKIVGDHDRHHKKGSYWALFRDRQEADKENKGKTFDFLWNHKKKYGPDFVTLPERIRMERLYFWATNRHLDLQCVTHCDGSYSSSCGHLSVCWSNADNRLEIDEYNLDYTDNNFRTRSCIVGEQIYNAGIARRVP